MWPFVHPGIAATAVVLAAIPIAIHLLSRRRYRREPWAAMRFLQRAQRRTRRRTRLEQWLLLALRTAVITLMALALARPLTQTWAAWAPLRGQRVDRVLILDDSGSMQAGRSDGQTAFHAAREAALRLLPTFGPNDGVAIVMTGHPARTVLVSVPPDEGTLRRVLTGAACSWAAADPAGAFEEARGFLDRNPLPADRRVVYVLSNLTRAAWTARPAGEGAGRDSAGVAQAFQRISEAARVVMINVDPSARPNAAVTALTYDDTVIGSEWPVTLAATVANFSDQPLAGAQVEFRVDGRVAQTAAMPPIEPGETGSVAASVRFERPGSRVVSARLLHGPDALPADDTRWRSVEVERGRQVLIVESGPRGGRPAESYYLARALAPRADASAGPFAVTTVSEQEFQNRPLGDTAVVILADVRRLPAEDWRRLSRFVREGGGLLIIAAERSSDDTFNRGPRDLLPATLRRQKDASDAGRSAGQTLRVDDWTHPILRDFSGQSAGGLLTATFSRFWEVVPEPDSRVVLACGDGHPTLIERRVGRGRVLLWTSSANMAWNNLAAKPDFVTLFLNAVGSLVPRPDAWRNGVVGDVLDDSVAPAAAGGTATLRTPDSDTRSIPIIELDGRAIVRVDTRCGTRAAWAPGPYELMAGSQGRGETMPHKLCLNIDPTISDLRAWTRTAFRSATATEPAWFEGVEGLIARSPAAAGGDLAEMLLLVVFALLLVETFVALSFGHRT